MSLTIQTPPAPLTEDEREAARVGATFRLAFARVQNPDLQRAEAQARLDLAAAIMAMDEAEDTDAGSLYEQAAVNEALQAYGAALADSIRGEAGSSSTDGKEDQR